MRVFVTGGTGFVGHELVSQLLAAEHEVICLARPGSEGKLARHDRLRIQPGDAVSGDGLDQGMAGCDAVIHLVGIIREFPARGITFEKLHVQATERVVAACSRNGIRRYLHMSANGTRPDAVSPYHRTKWQAEELVRNANLDWTIFRPSLIYGPGDQFVNMLADQVRKLPLVPVIGDGSYRMSPVAVQDVACSFVRALERPQTIGQCHHCGGPGSLSYNEILDTIGRVLGKNRVGKLHNPVGLLRPLVSLLEGFSAFPLTRSQMTMLLEGNEVDPAAWAQAFDIDPVPFEEGIRAYLK